MDLNEAQKILNKAGYLLEDKYMDDMDKELDQTVLLNNIVDAVKAAGYKKCGIKNDEVYVWPVDATERYCICIEKDDLFKDTFYCKILDREKHKYAAKYYFTIKGDTYKRNGFGEPPAFYGKLEDIVRPGKEYIEDAIKPGFFKRIFGKKNVQESYKNEIPDDVMELAEEVLNHSFYDLDWDVYELAEMGEDWLKDYLQELNDKEMRIACM